VVNRHGGFGNRAGTDDHGHHPSVDQLSYHVSLPGPHGLTRFCLFLSFRKRKPQVTLIDRFYSPVWIPNPRWKD
jgi:hypothetical protein